METQERLARNHLEKCKQAVVRHSRQQEQLKIAWQQAEDRVEELQSAIDGDATEDGKLDALQTSLQEHEGEKRTHESSFEDSVNKMDSIMETLKEKKREVTEIEMEIAEYRKKVENLEAKESKTLEKRRKALVDKNVVIDKLESLQGDKAHIVRKRQELGDIILDFTAKASSVSPRVAVSEGETANSLDKKLVRLKRDLDRFDKEYVYFSFLPKGKGTGIRALLMPSSLGDREKIATEAAEAEEKYESARRQVAELEELAQVITSMIQIFVPILI